MEDVLHIGLEGTEDGLRVTYRSACFEKHFRRLSADGLGGFLTEKAWEGKSFYVPRNGVHTGIHGLVIDSERFQFYDRERDTFNIYPLLAVGLEGGVSFETPDMIVGAEMGTLLGRYKELLRDFYIAHMRPVNMEVSLIFKKTERAAA